jgi:hypothetical protein
MKQAKRNSSSALEYINRKGDAYYLQAGQTKTGKPKYYLARKFTGTPLEAVPDGYEIHESPATAIAVVRTAQATRILPEERKLVEGRSREQSGLRHLIVDVEPDALVVYVPGTSDADLGDLFGDLGSPARRQAANDAIIVRTVYSPMLRFALYDADRRTFTAQRWCFLGGIDDWVFLAEPRSLADQVANYAKHLGKKSFYEIL